MRRIIGAVFVSLDGVMQAPGGPEEDRSGGFEYGGWLPQFWDDQSDEGLGTLFAGPFDLLLGDPPTDAELARRRKGRGGNLVNVAAAAQPRRIFSIFLPLASSSINLSM